MEIKWNPEGGVEILKLSAQEFGWLRRELGRAKPEVTRDAGDAMINQIRMAAPIDAHQGSKPDLDQPVL